MFGAFLLLRFVDIYIHSANMCPSSEELFYIVSRGISFLGSPGLKNLPIRALRFRKSQGSNEY